MLSEPLSLTFAAIADRRLTLAFCSFAAYENAMRDKKLQLAVRQSTRENNYYLENVGKSRMIQEMEERKKSKRKAGEVWRGLSVMFFSACQAWFGCRFSRSGPSRDRCLGVSTYSMLFGPSPLCLPRLSKPLIFPIGALSLVLLQLLARTVPFGADAVASVLTAHDWARRRRVPAPLAQTAQFSCLAAGRGSRGAGQARVQAAQANGRGRVNRCSSLAGSFRTRRAPLTALVFAGEADTRTRAISAGRSWAVLAGSRSQ